MVFDELDKHKSFAIYGAQVVAYGAYTAIKHLLNRRPECFIVSSLEGNPSGIEGIPVRTLSGIPADTLIIIGVTELLQDEIAVILSENGYKNTVRLTQAEEHLLMSRYFGSLNKFPALDPLARNTPVDLALFEVKNHRDKPLVSHPGLKPFEYSIQAGAAVTDERIAPILDNTGDNISAKNKQYCEMSAAYWVWKNDKHEWKGIEHYRRHLLVTPEMLSRDIDAVLPLPYICYPHTRAQLLRFADKRVVDALFRTLSVLYPDKYQDYAAIINGRYQYTYNMLCAKMEVFDDYCEWFFGITEHMEAHAEKAREISETRALSYIAEALTNIYFMYNQDKLNIRHAEKAIYI